MKDRLRYRLQMLCILCLAVAGLLGSCVAEPVGDTGLSGDGEGKQEVRLKLQVPGLSKSRANDGTRAVNESVESTVNDLYILVFKNKTGKETDDTFEYYAKAEKAGDAENWSAMLQAQDYAQNFIVVANAEGTADEMLVDAIEGIQKGATKTTVKQTLQVVLTTTEKTSGFNAADTDNHSPFTMCGQTAPTVIKAGGNNVLTVNLYRIMARVQVYFGDKAGSGVSKFVAETVRLCNFNDRAQVIPEELGMVVTKPSIPNGTNRCRGNAVYPVTGNKLQCSAYLFETAQPEDTEEDAHLNRPCLIIGGKYDGSQKTTYYRVDLKKDKEYLDVLRNHSYEVTVTGVGSAGHGSDDDALAAKAENDISTDIIVWDETEVGNIDFEGNNYLGVGTMEFTVGRNGATTEHPLTQKLTSNQAWTATLLTEDGTGTPDWIRFEQTQNNTASGDGGANTQDVSFIVDAKPAGVTADRTAIMRFTAGKLQVDAKVVQGNGNLVFINVTSKRVIIENGNEVTTNIEVEYGPVGTDLVWTLTQDEQLGVVTADGQATIGSAIGNAQTNKATISLKTNELLSADGTMKTGKALLKLFAQGEGGEQMAEDVELLQTNFKVELSKYSLPAYGQGEVKLYVDANAPWTATFDMGQDSRLGTFTTGFVDKQYTGGANTGTSHESSFIKFYMNKANFTENPVAPKVLFTTDGGHIYEVTVNMGGVFIDQGTPYEILQKEMSFADAVVNGKVPEDGCVLVNKNQALSITKYWKEISTWISDPAFQLDDTCPNGTYFCAWLHEGHQNEEEAGILQAHSVKNNNTDWSNVGGTMELHHEGPWIWDATGDVCHIFCQYKSWEKTEKKITLYAIALALNPTNWPNQKYHDTFDPDPEYDLKKVSMPIIGGEGVKYEIPNDRTGASGQHNASCHDYIYWNITGETVKNCLFLKPIK